MSEHELRPEHRRLRELLRDADPASEERLSPEEAAAMRRRMIEEAEAHAGAGSGLPGVSDLLDRSGIRGIAGGLRRAEIPWPRVVAVAATITVILGLALSADMDGWLPTDPSTTPSRSASTPPDADVPPTPDTESTRGRSPAGTPEAGTPDPAPGPTGTVAEAVPPPPPPSGEESGAAPADPAAGGNRRREPRDVRFTTPGGTEIVWTLDPDFELPGRPRNPGTGEPR